MNLFIALIIAWIVIESLWKGLQWLTAIIWFGFHLVGFLLVTGVFLWMIGSLIF